MNGCIFKRMLKSGTSWGYSFFAGRDQNGKRIQIFKSGFKTKAAASVASRAAIDDYEKTHGKVTQHRGIIGRDSWYYVFREEKKAGFDSRVAAEQALLAAVDRRAAAEAFPAEVVSTFPEYIRYWLTEHAARRCAPKTLERYRELAEYLVRQLGETRAERPHHGPDSARDSSACRIAVGASPKSTRTAGRWRQRRSATSERCCTPALAEADRLGVLKIPHPMANKRVVLPKLAKRDPPVLDKEKLQALFDRARNTRLYPFVVLASATGCRRGELLALQWTDLNECDRRTERLEVAWNRRRRACG